MAARVPARLTAAEGRRFGLTVGGAFLVLAAVVWWRGNATVSTVFASLGTLLALGGLLAPTAMGPVERAWMKFALALSKITTPVAMSVIYLLVILPVGWLRRTLGANPMVHAPGSTGFWKTRPPNARRSSSLQRQF